MQTNKFKQTEIGQIPEDWDLKPLKEVAKVNELTINRSFQHKNIEYLDVASIERGQIISVAKIALKDAPSRAKRIVRTNDFLISTVRPNLRHFAFIKEAKPNTIASTGFAVVTAKKVSSAFLYYYLTTEAYTNYLTAIADAHTSTYPAFNPDILEDSLVAYPPLQEQQSIAAILSSLDEKMELNQRMSRTLEAVGQTIFKHWFIDFEFPNEEGKPYKNSGGEMVDSELGEIPKGWKVGKLGDFIFVERGLSYKGSGLCENGIPMINLGNIAPHNHFRYEGIKYYSGEYKERNLVKPGDLVIANTDITQNREVLGSCLVVPADLSSDKIIFTHHIYAVRHKSSKLSNHFLSFLLQIPEYRERASGFATGTTVLALPEDAILNFNFILPSEDLMEKYDILVSYIKNKTAENIKESKSLSIIRDLLLPKLMSGKIRVPT